MNTPRDSKKRIEKKGKGGKEAKANENRVMIGVLTGVMWCGGAGCAGKDGQKNCFDRLVSQIVVAPDRTT